MEGKTGGREAGGWKKVNGGVRGAGGGSERARGSRETKRRRSFARTSAAMSRSEACNVGKGRIRIFLGPWLNVISFAMAGCTLAPYDPPCSPESRRRNTASLARSVNIARVLSLFIENASRILLRLRTVNQSRERENLPPVWNATVSPSCLRSEISNTTNMRDLESEQRSDARRRDEIRRGIFIKRIILFIEEASEVLANVTARHVSKRLQHPPQL